MAFGVISQKPSLFARLMGIAAPTAPNKHVGSVGASRSSLSHSTEEGGREEHDAYYNRSRRLSRRASMAHSNVRYGRPYVSSAIFTLTTDVFFFSFCRCILYIHHCLTFFRSWAFKLTYKQFLDF